MLPTLAWRNIWRSRTRSLVVIAAIAIGVWAAITMTGFATGMMRSYVNGAIETYISHIQIHHPQFTEEQESRFTIPRPEELCRELAVIPEVKGAALRSVTTGMIASSHGTRGVMIKAVQPEQEKAVTVLAEKMVKGNYFTERRRNSLLISQDLAEKLEVDVRKKVVLTFQDLSSNITSGAFRIVGIFNSGNTPFDESHVFVLREDLNRLLRGSMDTLQQPIGHEIALLLNRPEQAASLADSLQQALPDLKVQTYREISPDLQLYESQIMNVSYVYLVIIMLGLVFGIVNTMLMAVLERTREIGMLMAIGMNKLRVFTLIVLETLMLSFIGAPFGLALGGGTVAYVGANGIDLSAFSRSLANYGLADTLYFEVEQIVYLQVPIAVLITAVLASVYPALKAVSLRPVEAIGRG